VIPASNLEDSHNNLFFYFFKIDKINRIDKTNWSAMEYQFLKNIENIQTPSYLEKLYDTYKNNPMICWNSDLSKDIRLPDTVNTGKQ
jgi:hypothetical protein